MAIKIKKNGKIEQFTLHSTDVKVLDLEGKFKKKDLESVIREISNTEHIHIGEVDTTKDGIWIDDGEILDNSENNGVVERLKEYVNNKSNLIKLVNVEVDFNELEDGRYFINTSKESLQNAPNSISHGGILTVNKCPDGLSQILISYEGRVYYRKKWYVYWGEWSELMSSSQISCPNLLINGDFQVWQRGESFNTVNNGQYTADRWNIATPDGRTDGISLSKVENGGIRICNTSNKQVHFRQFIDGKDYAALNQEFTLSVKIKGKEPKILSGVVNGSKSIITSEGNFSFLVVCDNTHKTVNVEIITNDMDWIVEWVKLELGTVPTPFVPRSYAEELALCQRYYISDSFSFREGVPTTMIWDKFIPFKTHMRVTPTINASMYNTNYQNTLLDKIHFQVYRGQNLNFWSGETMLEAGVHYTVYYSLDAEIY